jgi:hypothetical protein
MNKVADGPARATRQTSEQNQMAFDCSNSTHICQQSVSLLEKAFSQAVKIDFCRRRVGPPVAQRLRKSSIFAVGATARLRKSIQKNKKKSRAAGCRPPPALPCQAGGEGRGATPVVVVAAAIIAPSSPPPSCAVATAAGLPPPSGQIWEGEGRGAASSSPSGRIVVAAGGLPPPSSGQIWEGGGGEPLPRAVAAAAAANLPPPSSGQIWEGGGGEPPPGRIVAAAGRRRRPPTSLLRPDLGGEGGKGAAPPPSVPPRARSRRGSRDGNGAGRGRVGQERPCPRPPTLSSAPGPGTIFG